ncbi:hypothetical protein SDC9_153595 [bioreactor metagenome]|uniref:Uncharacterized protein n=1 Tax=bioreactor metagenome TaxID=1076179 RepID=A0A645EYS9_9ZZZZ
MTMRVNEAWADYSIVEFSTFGLFAKLTYFADNAIIIN